MAKDDTSAEVVGLVLSEARERAGRSQQQVAGDGGVDRSYLSDVERGEASLSVDRLLKIARGIGVPAAELLARVEARLAKGGVKVTGRPGGRGNTRLGRRGTTGGRRPEPERHTEA